MSLRESHIPDDRSEAAVLSDGASPRYVSTRGEGDEVSFEHALLAGLAPDGGLFAPKAVPTISDASWRERSSIADLGAGVLRQWLEGQTDAELIEQVLEDALSFSVPLVPLQGGDFDDVFVLELFHGPTLSFKDFGARTMARFMGRFLEERRQELTILVATSGDTGSAVADGFAGQRNVKVGLLYPKGQVSPVQERQLIVERTGVRSFAVRGSFDDCQRMVKEAFVDPGLSEIALSSANSINIGRLLPQMLYYFDAFRTGGFDRATVCVPSGNLTAGVLAALSGLPVKRFIAAHNENDFFPQHLVTGDTAYKPSRRTLSSAMDVGVPSNFERLRMLLSPEEMKTRIWGTSVSDEETRASMRRVYDETGYVADPHTAVGLEGVRRYRNHAAGAGPFIVLSTAHPAKFPEIVKPVLGFEPETPGPLAALWERPTQVEEIDPSLDALRSALLAA